MACLDSFLNQRRQSAQIIGAFKKIVSFGWWIFDIKWESRSLWWRSKAPLVYNFLPKYLRWWTWKMSWRWLERIWKLWRWLKKKLWLGRRNTWYNTNYILVNFLIILLFSGADIYVDGEVEDCWSKTRIWREKISTN